MEATNGHLHLQAFWGLCFAKSASGLGDAQRVELTKVKRSLKWPPDPETLFVPALKHSAGIAFHTLGSWVTTPLTSIMSLINPMSLRLISAQLQPSHMVS